MEYTKEILNKIFKRSPDDKDQELNNLNSSENISKLESVVDSPSELISPLESRSPFKNRLSLKSNSSNKGKLIHNNSFERGESILFERKSIAPELETTIKWNDLSVSVNVKGKPKKILDNVCGEVNNLEIMAILGPSGAGKTTLLNTIAGRVKNYSGSVNFYSKDKRISFAYVPQVDHLPSYMTVKECLLFSSRLKNPPDTNHVEEVNYVLTAFNLWKAKNHYSVNCSGGERKRLSIGLEMISKPKILILDEPTSGLDSTTSYIVIEVLKNINKNTAIITTIHQPNSNLFQLFDKCYILAGGKCVYNGTPKNIVDHLKDNFSAICPNFTNPADYILDIVNDTKTEKGINLIEKLANYEYNVRNKDENYNQKSNDNNKTFNGFKNQNQTKIFIDPVSDKEVELQLINRSSLTRKSNFFREYFENFKKLLICSSRDSQETFIRFMNNTAFPMVIYAITYRQLNETGCTFLPLNSTHILNEDVYERYDRQLKGTQGVGIAFINIMFAFFSALIPAVLVLSQHINVVKKEYTNSYYTIGSFFFAVISVNLLLAFIYSIFNTLSFFYFTGPGFEAEKMIMFWLMIFLSTILGNLSGFILAIIYPEDNLTAVVVGSFQGFSVHMLSGFFVPLDTMREWVQKFSWLVFCRHSFEAVLRIFYGHGKCKISDEMIFDFDNLVEFIKYYNYENHGDLQDIDDMPLKVKNALRDKIWNKAAIMEMAEEVNDLNETEIARLNDFWDTKTSYILDSFSCQDQSLLFDNIAICVITWFVLLFICYVMLRLRINK